MDEQPKFYRIKNWERYQIKIRADKRGRLPWVRDYTDREQDPDFRSLTCLQRYLLTGMIRIAAKTPSRLVQADLMYILSELHVLPEERHCTPQAIAKLLSRGLLIPENNQNYYADLAQSNSKNPPETGDRTVHSASSPRSLTGIGETGEGTCSAAEAAAPDRGKTFKQEETQEQGFNIPEELA